MGLMTRDEMVTEVEGLIARSDMTTYIQGWLSRALFDLSTYHRFYENEKSDTITLSSGAHTITSPTDMLVPVRIEPPSTYTPFRSVPIKDFIYVRDLYRPNNYGFPNYAARFGTLLYVDRPADREYILTLFYKYRPVAFAGGSSVSPLGHEWDEAFILWAQSKAYERMRMPEASKEYKNKYYAYVKGRMPEKEQMAEQWNESFAGEMEDYSDAYTY